MKYAPFFLVAGAAAFLYAAHVPAQEIDNTGTDVPAWVDADGDGINDVAAMRRERRGGNENAYAESRRQLMAELTANLTDEQKAELTALRNQLREDHATPEAVQAALGEKLQSFGITLPDAWYQTRLEFEGGFTLTAEQRAQVQALMESLRTDGKTPEERRAAVVELLTSYGITVPDNFMAPPERGNGPRGDRGRGPILTEEQRTAVDALVASMKEEGKTRAEIQAAVGELMASYGITAPVRRGPPEGTQAARSGLTNQQKAEVQALVRTMRAEGRSAAEIRDALAAKFNQYGVAMPPQGKGPRGR
ncbi:MAG TPA: hypothetical protein PLM66_02630 [Candidatus Latescibacteria bacterium]|nr:hypothetical protein [Candidatus Latescibacterota bacterium]